METSTESTLKVSSPAFEEGQEIPVKYTCDGENINPPIKIEELPDKTVSLVMFVEDPDSPQGTFDHWVVWNIEPENSFIEENTIPGVQGKNGSGGFGYKGPCPSDGTTHRYYFNIYALDKNLQISGADTYKQDLLKAMSGCVLAKGHCMGRYTKK